MNEHDELHLFGAKDTLELVVGLVVVPLQVLQRRVNTKRTYDQVFVGSNKRLVAQLQLQVDSQSFDSVPHTVGGRHARQILQKVRQCPLVWRLFPEVLVVAHIAL